MAESEQNSAGPRMRFTILGCGASPGTPRIGGDWGKCDPLNPKNRRSRASLLVERISNTGKTTIVVDTGPDFRQQMISANVEFAEAVFYTHAHADHIHGIDDLRGFAINRRKKVEIYATTETSERLHLAFDYCFKTPEGGSYPPILIENIITAGQVVTIEGPGGALDVLPFAQQHGDIISLGFRFGDVAYSSDINGIPKETESLLEGLDCWIVDALQYIPHPSHFSLDEALQCIERVGPKRAILTHMHTPLDYETVRSQVPDHVLPAYDGLSFEVAC